MITPYDNVPLLVAEEGAVNFLSLYGGVLTLRILLSWFPQAQGFAFLQPIFTVSDVYLNLFRGVIPASPGWTSARSRPSSCSICSPPPSPRSAPRPSSGSSSSPASCSRERAASSAADPPSSDATRW